jgi:hypothetical protein
MVYNQLGAQPRSRAIEIMQQSSSAGLCTAEIGDASALDNLRGDVEVKKLFSTRTAEFIRNFTGGSSAKRVDLQ